MLPSGHYQAVITLHDTWAYGKGAADRFLKHYITSHRYIGSKDRQQIATLFFGLFRHRRLLDEALGEPAPKSYKRLLAYLLLKETLSPEMVMETWHQGKYAPPPLDENDFLSMKRIAGIMLPKDAAIRESVPPFFEASLKAALGKNFQQEMVLMNTPAPFDLRVNISRISRQRVLDIFEKDGLYGTPTPYSPWGIRFKERVPLNAHPLYEQGLIDIQDEGAQSLVYDCPSPEADSPLLLDYCAGAGGKTLAFAEKWLRHGTFVMTDYEPHRLEKARERLKRQGIKAKLIPFDQAKLAPYQEKADMVFVDAPCTGTGTWRRNPELKWAFDQQKFHTLLETQGQILEKASSYVKQGGLLAYATCSLLPEENDHQIKRFLEKQDKAFTLAQDIPFGKNYTPFTTGTDGYYLAVLKKRG